MIRVARSKIPRCLTKTVRRALLVYWLAQLYQSSLSEFWFELLTSRVILASFGFLFGALLTGWFLPRSFGWLPRDRGRAFTPRPELAEGKPTGAGAVFIPIFVLTAFLFVPWNAAVLQVLGCTLVALAAGYLDDRGRGWDEYSKAGVDLVLAVLVALALSQGEAVVIWVPFVSDPITLSPLVYLTIASLLLWVSINATNCTDGVDGLSGSLLLLAYFYLGALLYAVVGHTEISAYLGVLHDPEAATWGVLAFSILGSLAAYLWYNAHPSQVLMGDSGSRPLGLLLGVFVLATHNPVLILVVAGVVLINGGTGLVKVALLRFFNIGIFGQVRFPLHDHCRVKLGWSNTQVLMRFMLLQAILTPILFVLLLRVL